MIKHRRFFFALAIPLQVGVLLSALLAPAAHATAPLGLGRAGNFQLLAGSAMTIGAGVVGIDPDLTAIGGPGVIDLNATITTASGITATPVAADLGGLTFQPGVYSSTAAFAITGNVTLDGAGNANSQFIFFTPAAGNTTAGITMKLINGAQACNIYWIASGAWTIGASGGLAGNFLSAAAMTIGASSTITGRLLAGAALTVGASTVFSPFSLTGCAPVVGSITISTPESLNLASVIQGATGSRDMAAVSVSDTRGSSTTASWDVSVVSTVFTNSNGDTIPASAFSYTPTGLVTSANTIISIAVAPSLAVPFKILSASGADSTNSATWIPRISVSVPVGQAPGTYSGVITHSVY